MPSYCILINFTDQGIRSIRDAGKRLGAAKDLGKSLGVQFKDVYLAMGQYDLVTHVEASSDEAVAKFVLAIASRGNVKTTTMRTFNEQEYLKIVGGLPA
jgi:uncharacterized protein with GYD domain